MNEPNILARSSMTTKLMSAVFLFTGLLLVSIPASAHHGVAAYDMGNRITLKGTIAAFDWSNPHSQIHLDVTDEKGNVVHWAGEVGSPSAMNQMGWNRNSVKPGDVITVYFYQAKTGNPVGRINKIVLADGTTLRDSALGADKPGQDPTAH